ncbi:hypothetical protein HPB48_003617 [Haemaphysalis longicornis]|uniref:Glycosylphosphatidylinositol anchor attachment 1 protein n=1 Tax=Haemaphysalis longicornis TaxID=44386 RepID=A0A9J6F7F4_HAELO|nr:hypothetical protein HPB48_003617 [Haemaphysalis longicornis]
MLWKACKKKQKVMPGEARFFYFAFFCSLSVSFSFNLEQRHSGENVYAILRAPRAASTEAVVFSAPYRLDDSLHGSTLPGIALMVALAKYFRGQGSWAKDIIFLVTEHELVGFQAWLDAYHDVHTAPGVIDPGILAARSGPIQAAINLELHSSRIKRLDVKLVGLNGQLPNLDLFNLVAELCLRESVHITFHDQVSPYDVETFEGWLQSFKTMTAMMAAQATGQPNGGHGLFHRYAIQALTLEGHADGAASVTVGFDEVGRVLEGVFSSLNNLLERFHQSFFFYLLPSTRRYVSIGLYSPAFALVGLPALIKVSIDLPVREKATSLAPYFVLAARVLRGPLLPRRGLCAFLTSHASHRSRVPALKDHL